MNTSRNAIESDLYEYAVRKGCDLRWDNNACYVVHEKDSYAVCLIGNWPSRVRSRIDWNYEKAKKSL